MRKLKSFLFPGQGSQALGMGKFLLTNPNERAWVSPVMKKFSEILEFDLEKMMLEGPLEELNMTYNAQPAIFVNSFLAMEQYKRTIGDEEFKLFTHAAGNSVGEVASLVASGCFDPFSAAKLLQARGRLMQEACKERKCGMLAVLTSDMEEINNRIKQVTDQGKLCEIAVYASNKQIVLTGDLDALKQIQGDIKKAKRIVSILLHVSAAFHCKLLTPIKGEYRKLFENIEITPPKLTVYRNIDLKLFTTREEIIEGLVEQFDKPVLFRHTIEKLLDEAQQNNQELEFVELGTTGLLAKLVRDIQNGHPSIPKEQLSIITVY